MTFRRADRRSPSSSSRPRLARRRPRFGQAIRKLEALSAELRLRHLWRRRLDPRRARSPPSRASLARHVAYSRRASHLRRQRPAHEVDEVVRDYLPTPASATSWRCAAIRRAESAAAMADIRSGYRNAAELVARHPRPRRFRNLGRGLSREASRESFTLEVDLAMLADKVDNGATSALTQFFFDNSAYFRDFVDRGAGPRHRHPDHSRHPAGHQFRARQGVRSNAAAPRLTSGSRPPLPGAGEAPEERAPGGGAVAAEQVDGAARRGRQQLSLLYAQPRRCRVRDLPDARAGRQHPHGRGLNGGMQPSTQAARAKAGARSPRPSPGRRTSRCRPPHRAAA